MGFLNISTYDFENINYNLSLRIAVINFYIIYSNKELVELV